MPAFGPESDAAVLIWLVAVALVGLAIPLFLVWGAAWIIVQVFRRVAVSNRFDR